jgi:hypothetical protein
MTKISDTQSIILSQASQHDALFAMAPANLLAAARQAVFRSMLKNLLLEELPAPAEYHDMGWRQDDEARGLPCASRPMASPLGTVLIAARLDRITRRRKHCRSCWRMESRSERWTCRAQTTS